MRVGIILGAGGPLGWAYHLGVIEGMRDAIGREATSADRIVGTSAGAPIAASVLTGATTAEVLAAISEPPSSEEQEQMKAAGGSALKHPLRLLRPMAPHLVGSIRRVGFATAAVGLLPAGVFPTVPLRKLLTDTTETWPDRLWIPSVRIDDGETVIFGRDPVDVSLADAIEATSAIPGLFRPKRIDGSRYVDGAVASATHADALLTENLDVALISSPMTRPGRGLIKTRARRQLTNEVNALEQSGVRVLVVSPTPEVLEAAEGFPRSRPHAGAEIVEVARAQTITAFGDHLRNGG